MRGLKAPPRIQERTQLAQAPSNRVELLGTLNRARAGEDDDLIGCAIGNVGLAHARISFITLRMVA